MILPIGGIALLASPQVPAAKGPRPNIKSQRKPTLKPSAQPHPDPSEEDLTSDHEEQEVFIVRPKGGNSDEVAHRFDFVEESGMGRSSIKETGTELGCDNIGQSGLRAEAEVFVPDPVPLTPSVSYAQQGTSTAIAATDPPLEMTTGGTGLAETLIEERDSNTRLPVPAGQSTCSDNSPTGTSEVGENVSSCDEEKSSDSPACDDSGGNLQTAVQSERNCIDVEPNSGTTDERDGSSGVLVVEEPCPESACFGSETQSESEEGSISEPHPHDSEEDAGYLQNHPSRPTRTRLPPKRYTYDYFHNCTGCGTG